MIGAAFVYVPLGVEGLLKYLAAAKILDRAESDEMRRGFSTGLFNLRGVHGYTTGKEELQIANTYQDDFKSTKIEAMLPTDAKLQLRIWR